MDSRARKTLLLDARRQAMDALCHVRVACVEIVKCMTILERLEREEGRGKIHPPH